MFACLLLFKLDNHISDRTLGQSASKSLKQERQKSRQIFQISLLENGHKWWGEGGYPWVWPVSGHNLVPSPSWDNSQVSKACLTVSTWIKLKMSLHAFKKDPNVANQKVMIGSWHKNHLIFIIIRFRLGPDCIVHDIRLFTNYPTGEIFERGTYKELAWQNTNPRSGKFYLGKFNYSLILENTQMTINQGNIKTTQGQNFVLYRAEGQYTWLLPLLLLFSSFEKVFLPLTVC